MERNVWTFVFVTKKILHLPCSDVLWPTSDALWPSYTKILTTPDLQFSAVSWRFVHQSSTYFPPKANSLLIDEIIGGSKYVRGGSKYVRARYFECCEWSQRKSDDIVESCTTSQDVISWCLTKRHNWVRLVYVVKNPFVRDQILMREGCSKMTSIIGLLNKQPLSYT